jgi:hypothetical protein
MVQVVECLPRKCEVVSKTTVLSKKKQNNNSQIMEIIILQLLFVFWWWYWGLNSGPHTCYTGTLTLDPLCQLHQLLIKASQNNR